MPTDNLPPIPPGCPMFMECNGDKIFSIFDFHTDRKTWSHDSDFPVIVRNCGRGTWLNLIAATAYAYWMIEAERREKELNQCENAEQMQAVEEHYQSALDNAQKWKALIK